MIYPSIFGSITTFIQPCSVPYCQHQWFSTFCSCTQSEKWSMTLPSTFLYSLWFRIIKILSHLDSLKVQSLSFEIDRPILYGLDRIFIAFRWMKISRQYENTVQTYFWNGSSTLYLWINDPSIHVRSWNSMSSKHSKSHVISSTNITLHWSSGFLYAPDTLYTYFHTLPKLAYSLLLQTFLASSLPLGFHIIVLSLNQLLPFIHL